MAKASSASPQRIPHRPSSKKRNVSVPTSPTKLPWNPSKGRTAESPLNDVDIIRDGKFFHLRLRISELTGVSIVQLFSEDESTSSSSHGEKDEAVYVYAGIETEKGCDATLKYTVSLPLNPAMNKQNVRWPKRLDTGEPIIASTSRLYHAVLLRTDGSSNLKTMDGVLDTSLSIYAPETVNIHLGFIKGDEKVPLGVATLTVNGKDMVDEKMQLPVCPVQVTLKKNRQEIEKKSGRSFRKFLGGGAKKKDIAGEMQTTIAPQSTFSRGDKFYRVPDTSILRFHLDVMGGVYESSGPSFWGDLVEDRGQESIYPMPVVEVPYHRQGEVTDKYLQESIEVMNDNIGITILSSPGAQLPSADDETSTSCSFVSPFSETADNTISPLYRIPDAICGAVVNSVTDEHRYINTNYSFASTLPDVDDSAQSRYSLALPPALLSAMARLTESDDMEEGHNTGTSTSDQGGVDVTVTSEEDDDTNDDTGTTSGIDTVGLESVDKAKATLQRYASKFGVAIEDLLDDESRP